ncbi:MAG: elongation factor G [Planctomycetaceae bacterium]|nr:elongation factor G [Planctomycetaceae bacterium]
MNTIHNLRNVGISAHIDSGKTTLTERMLYYCGRIHRMGDVKGREGSATMDFDPIEIQRGITISSAVTQVQWDEHRINIIDTPGHVDFTIEVERSLRVLDGAVLVLCAVGGVQSQSMTVDRQMKRYGVPRIAFINKMDRAGADPQRVILQIREKLRCHAVALQLPVGREENFRGVIDLITMEAIYFEGADGRQVERSAVPLEMQQTAAAARAELLEELSKFDDALMEILLNGEDPGEHLLYRVIREATLAHRLTPVLMGTAYRNKGVQEVLTAITRYLPSPADRVVTAINLNPGHRTSQKAVASDVPEMAEQQAVVELSAAADVPLVAMAFKSVVESFGQLTFLRLYQGRLVRGDTYRNARTGRRMRVSRLLRIHADKREDIAMASAGDIVAVVGLDCASGDTFTGHGIHCTLESMFVPEPVMRVSIEACRSEDFGKLAKALEAFRREDPTFRVFTDARTGQTLIAGMGQLHLDVYLQKLKQLYQCECATGQPQVAYRQHPSCAVDFEYVLRKMTGGPGQFAQIKGRMIPLGVDGEKHFEFVNHVRGGRIPREFIPAVEQGFLDELNRGPLGEFEVVGVRIDLLDGAYHENDSSELSFRLCAQAAMRDVILPNADVRLLEPVMSVEVEVPARFQGGVTGHLASRRGLVTGSETRDGSCLITAVIPLAEMFHYADELRCMTQGQGVFSMAFCRYAPMPADTQRGVLQ